jgi:hypothetical protein
VTKNMWCDQYQLYAHYNLTLMWACLNVSTWLKPLDIHITALLKICYADQHKQWQGDGIHVVSLMILFSSPVVSRQCFEYATRCAKQFDILGGFSLNQICALPKLGKPFVIKGIPGTRLRVSTAFTLIILVFWDVTLRKGKLSLSPPWKPIRETAVWLHNS